MSGTTTRAWAAAGRAAAMVGLFLVEPNDLLAQGLTTAGSSDNVAGCALPAGASALTTVTPWGLVVVSLACLALLGSCLIALARTAFGTADASRQDRRRLRLAGLWLVALFITIVGAKLLLMRDIPATVPYWDQWDATAANLYIPYAECRLSWSTMFSLHNEHRVFFTRLLALDLIVANGEWDPRLEQVINAGLHAMTAVVITTILWTVSARRRLEWLVAAAALTSCAPFGYENTLAGFQSNFSFLILFSILALWLTTIAPPWTARWWLGWVCAICALFTSAGGVLTAAAIAGVAALAIAAAPSAWRMQLPNLAAAAAVLVLGAATASPPLAAHEPLRAHGLSQFRLALTTNLAWPWLLNRWAALALWGPTLMLAAAIARRRLRSSQDERLTAGWAAWVFLNAVAVAFGRGAVGLPDSRYMEFLSLGIGANLLALGSLTAGWQGRGVRVAGQGLALVWLTFVAVGIDRLSAKALVTLAGWRTMYAAHAANIREVIATGDRAAFVAKRPLYDLPYPGPERLADLLATPALARVLPAVVRRPLHTEAQPGMAAAFVTTGPNLPSLRRATDRPAWWSLSGPGRAATGSFESTPITCQPGLVLRIDLAGYLGWPGQSLVLRTLRTAEEIPVRPPSLARESWISAWVPCPDEPFVMVATDGSTESWFAFAEPLEVGRGSLWAERAIARGRGLLLLGLLLMALALRRSGDPALAP